MSRLEAVIYDMDGVLIDSEPFWQESEITAFNRIGVRLTHEDCTQTMGLRIDQAVEYWLERRPWDVSVASPVDVAGWVVDGVMAFVRSEGRLLPGVHESLSFFRDRGCRIALACSSSFEIIRCVLDALELKPYFEVVHSAEREVHGKPAPDVYLSTLSLLGVSAETCVAIEDSRNGVTSAKAAGLQCIAVPDPLATDKAAFAHADVVIDSLNAIDDELMTNLGF